MESQSANKSTRRPQSNRELNAAHSDLLDRLLEQGAGGEDFFGPDGVFTKLKGAVMERLLQAELASHLEREQEGAEAAKNARNGYSDKTVQTETGPVPIRVPRDRNGTFEPALVKKHQRRVEGFDEKVLALYARGMTTRDIQAHLRELYGTDVSHELISKATDAVLPDFRDWHSRSLESIYPVLYLDALFVSVRDGVQVQKRAFYVALGIRLDGKREVLGIWAAEAEVGIPVQPDRRFRRDPISDSGPPDRRFRTTRSAVPGTRSLIPGTRSGSERLRSVGSEPVANRWNVRAEEHAKGTRNSETEGTGARASSDRTVGRRLAIDGARLPAASKPRRDHVGEFARDGGQRAAELSVPERSWRRRSPGGAHAAGPCACPRGAAARRRHAAPLVAGIRGKRVARWW
jgi:hypothetical protein